jgi:diguanylate cyclase (GGDEF)-like protein
LIPRFVRENSQGATAAVALGLIGLILLYNGTLDLPALDRSDRNWLIVTCVVTGTGCVVLCALCLLGRIRSFRAIEAAMVAGLAGAIVANFVTGHLWPDSLWITCGYTMTLAVAAGITLRTLAGFGLTCVLLLAAWLLAVNYHRDDFNAGEDATTLVVIGLFIGVAVFAILRVERQGQADLTRRLRTQLDHDALTGVLNRTGLMSGLERLREASGGRGPVWCAYVDVDFFKSINDRLGHDYGDEVLREVARGLTEVAGPDGLVSRWGGDEFVIVAPGTPPDEQDIERDVSRGLARLDLDAAVTAGITVSDWRENPQAKHLVDRADLRMYDRRERVRAPLSGETGIQAGPGVAPPRL